MSEASRDDNRVVTLSGVNNSGRVVPLQVDSVTGRLLVAINIVASTSPAVGAGNAERDDNHVPVALVVDPNGDPHPLLVDARNDGLWVDNA